MVRFAKKDSRCKDVLSVIASEEWIESSSDKYGFSMFPGGMRDCGDDFVQLGYSACFWVREEGNRYDCISFEEGFDGINDGETLLYASVRLVKNAEDCGTMWLVNFGWRK